MCLLAFLLNGFCEDLDNLHKYNDRTVTIAYGRILPEYMYWTLDYILHSKQEIQMNKTQSFYSFPKT
jgi:hypothetical protein